MDNKIRFNDLDHDVQKQYAKQLAAGSFTLLFFVVCAICTGLFKEFLILAGFALGYVGYIVFDIFYVTRNNSLFVFTGTCKNITKPEYDLKIKKYYGEARIVLENGDVQCIVPISRALEITENDTATVICKQQDVYKDGDFFSVTKPLVVRLKKYA